MKKNPFSTKFITLGKIPYYFSNEFQKNIKKELRFRDFYIRGIIESDHPWTHACLLYLAEQLQQNGYFSQIFGPHGTGKSTFLNAFIEILKKQGIACLFAPLYDKQRYLSTTFWNEFKVFSKHEKCQKLIIIDGYEQLSYMERFRLRCRLALNGSGLLISVHHPVKGIPILYQTRFSFQTLDKIFEFLLEAQNEILLPKEELISIINKHHENVREILFECYDLYEEKKMSRQ